MKTKLNPESLYWATFNRFELRLSGQCVIDCSHAGECDSDVESWIDKVKKQIESDNFPNKPTVGTIFAELADYGAWTELELQDNDVNFKRLIWIAAGNIADEENPDCSAPVK